ncbi:dienelactone hydrolase family protein [Nocardioides sp. Soil796]|uniref:dienelactone hydrolase family protein n=1 Tax=Nocardioides sp. Soil796 TaxID=1736412 RepID=UPI000708F356|nr:dienelactone hydrolase family protein [Nocardioides sp. Soil796]KRF14741.1 hypothetical protein ASH02_10655 [Nocardioides sp. Soil796]
MNDVIMIDPTRSALDTATGPLPVLEISLPGTPHGVVLLFCDMGTLDRDAATRMNHLAEDGYDTLAVEVGDGVLEVLPVLLQRAAERGWSAEQVAVVGIGTGGRAALTVAAHAELAAAVSFSAPLHGSTPHGSPPHSSPLPDRPARTPWLGLFGAEDTAAPADRVRTLAATMSSSDVFTKVVRYPGVGPDFHARLDDGLNYAASYDGWQRTVEWLNARVAPRLSPLAVAWRSRTS